MAQGGVGGGGEEGVNEEAAVRRPRTSTRNYYTHVEMNVSINFYIIYTMLPIYSISQSEMQCVSSNWSPPVDYPGDHVDAVGQHKADTAKEVCEEKGGEKKQE